MVAECARRLISDKFRFVTSEPDCEGVEEDGVDELYGSARC